MAVGPGDIGGTRIGYGGTAHAGTSLTGSDIWNSAEIQEWTASLTVDAIDMSGGNDKWATAQPGRQKVTGTIKKMVAAAPEFLARITSANPVVYLTLRLGENTGATPGAGDKVYEGLALLTGVNLGNPNMGQVVEDVSFQFLGDPTPA